MKIMKEKKIKEFIFHNFPLKILAVVIAVILWIIVVNVDDPVRSKTVSGITVTLLNGDVLDSMGYTYAVESGAVISISVKATQQVIDDLKASDFYAYADLSERTENDTVKINVRCIKEGYENKVDITSLKTEYVKLSIDNKISKEYTVEIEYTGTPEENYVVADMSTSPTVITVSGAETTINQIETVKVTYDITNMTQNITETVSPVFYDADGNTVNTEMLELSRDTVRLDIEILPTKWVAVNYALSGELEDDYELTGEEASLSSVCIAGTKDNLAKISSIDIPAGVLDLTGLTGDHTFTVALSTYLSSEYQIVSSESTLTVTVGISKYVETVVTVPYSDIAVKGLADGYEAQIQQTGAGLSVTVRSLEENADALDSSLLAAAIDLTGYAPGQYTVPVSFQSNSDYTVEQKYTLRVTVTDPHAAEETEEETETETESEEESTETEANTENE